MSSLHVQELLNTMWDAFSQHFESSGEKLLPALAREAKQSLEDIAHRMVEIAGMLATNSISESEAKTLLVMQQQSTTEQLLAATGIAEVLLQSSLNAALSAVKDTVNAAIGFALL